MSIFPYSAFSPQHEWNYHQPDDKSEKPMHVSACGIPLLTAPFPTLDHCLAPLERMFGQPAEVFLDEVERSGLRGRGGAGLPLGQRLTEYRMAAGKRKYVVYKRDERSTDARIDCYLLEKRPVAVLLGMLAAGYAIGAEIGVVFVAEENAGAVAGLEQAIEALYDWGLAGEALLGSSHTFHFQLVKLPGARAELGAGAALPGLDRQRPGAWLRSPEHARSELARRPSLIQNGETLANLFYVLVQGAASFRSRGTRRSPGTKLLSLEGPFHRPGLYEVEMGTTVQQLMLQAGGLQHSAAHIRIGGDRGKRLPLEAASDLRIDYESFSREGLLLGQAACLGS